jgi:hypothetical protein
MRENLAQRDASLGTGEVCMDTGSFWSKRTPWGVALLLGALLSLPLPLIASVQPASVATGSCDGFANYVDELKARDFEIIAQTPLPDNFVQVQIGFVVDNADVASFNSASVFPDIDDLVGSLGAIKESMVPAILGPINPNALNLVPISALTVTLPNSNLGALIERLNSGLVPMTVFGDEQIVLDPGVTLTYWGSLQGGLPLAHDDAGYANARDNYGLNPEPVEPFETTYSFSIISNNLPNGDSQQSVFDGWTPGNLKYYVVEGPKSSDPLASASLVEVPAVLQNLRVTSVVKTVDGNSSTTRWDVTAQRVVGDAIALLYTSASFCSGESLHVDHSVHRSRLEFVDGLSTTDPNTPPPPGEERDRASQPIRFNNVEPTDGLRVSGQVQGHILKPHLELRFRNLKARVVGTFDTDLTLTAEARAYKAVDIGGEDSEQALYDLCFPLTEIPAGPVTININLELEHVVGFSGSAEFEAVIGIQKRFHEWVQVGFDARKPPSERFFSSMIDLSQAMDFTPPQLTDRTQAHARIYTRLTPMLYVSVEDPNCRSGGRLWADVTAFGTADVTPTQVPWWQLGTGVDLTGGMAFGVLGLDFASHQFGTTHVIHEEVGSAHAATSISFPQAQASGSSPRISGDDQRWSLSVDDLDYNTGYRKTSVSATLDNGALVSTREATTGRGGLFRLDDHGAYQWGLKYKSGLDVVKVLSLPDGGFFVAGVPHWLARHDASGNLIWSRDIDVAPQGETGRCDFNGATWFESVPGQYDVILVGRSVLDSNAEACALRIDSAGNVVWAKTYDGPDAGKIQSFENVTVTLDQKIVAVGSTDGIDGLSYHHGLVAKLNLESGQVVWARRFGVEGRGGDFYDVVEGPDGMLLAVGNLLPSVNWTGSAWLLRVEADGAAFRSATIFEDIYWEGRLPFGPGVATQGGHTPYDTLYGIAPMSEGFAVVGKTGPDSDQAAWAAKVNTQFGVEWMATYDGAGTDRLDGVAATPDGLLVSGWSSSLPGTSAGEDQVWIMKLPLSGRNTLLPEAGMTSHYPAAGVKKFGGFGAAMFSVPVPLNVRDTDLRFAAPIVNLLAAAPRVCVRKLSQSGDPSILDACERTTQVVNFNPIAERTIGDPDFVLTATGGASGNPVTFASLSPWVCATSGADGSNLSLIAVGICNLRARQAGDANFEAAEDVYQSFNVLPQGPPATAIYTPDAGTFLALLDGIGTIQVDYVPGGMGGTLMVNNCVLSDVTGSSFIPPVLTPDPISFAGGASAPGVISIGCATPSAGGTALLSCEETVFPESPVVRNWNLDCPSTLLAPSVSYSPAMGTVVTSSLAVLIGDQVDMRIDVDIGTDGAGIGTGATTTVDQCVASNGWLAETTPLAGISAVGEAGATGRVDVYCQAGEQPVDGSVTCVQARAGVTADINWPVHCPAGISDVIFASGFD